MRDRVWDFGDIWLGERKSTRRKTAIYVARRLNEPETIARVKEALQTRAHRPSGVILTTTNDPDLARMLSVSGCAALPIKACARAGGASFALDTAVVYAAAHDARPIRAESPIQVDGEFRVVRVGQREFHFRGDKQRQVVGFLHQKWNEDHGPISTALMFTELEFPTTTRLRDLFRGRDDWKELIGYQGGSCWLRYDDLLAADKVTSD